MKKKIIGILICMLLIATAIPALGTLNNSMIPNVVSKSITQSGSYLDFVEIQKLLASDGAAPDNFGYSVSLDGDTALIGAIGDDGNKGSAYVFIQTGTTWTQQAKLNASDGVAGDRFGKSVAVSGDTALIGAYKDDGKGSAYVFTRTGTTWTQQAKLFDSAGAAQDDFGKSVSLDGNYALIGAPQNGQPNIKGSAYIFNRAGTTWSQQAKLIVNTPEDTFGYSVSLHSDTALIGDVLSRYVFVFTRTGTTWTLKTWLNAWDNPSKQRFFGASVSFDGVTALIGATQDDVNGAFSGSAYTWTWNGTSWNKQQKFLAFDGAANDQFGTSVSIDGDTAFIGAPGDDSNKGSAYVYAFNGTAWTLQQKLLSSDGTAGDKFCESVSLGGDTALIGADGDDGGKGSGYVFMALGEPALDFNITGGLGVHMVITNNGTANATDVEWEIHVKGGLFKLLDKTVNGTITIPMGEPQTVSTGMFLGLGPFTITARVAENEKTAEAVILLIFVYGIE